MARLTRVAFVTRLFRGVGVIFPEVDADPLVAAFAAVIGWRADLPSIGSRPVKRARAWTMAQSHAERPR